MKWKNIDIGPAYYYITGTITEWLPLLGREEIRCLVCDDITAACETCGASVAAYVIMPDHMHLLVGLPQKDTLHKFCKLWRGRSGRHIPRLLEKQNDIESLQVLAKHANGGCRYAAWKEQVRALAVWTRPKLYTMVNYIHANPVRRGLVQLPGDWDHSSYRFYESGKPVDLAIVPVEP
jgi:REP element-mobilizing transposase RayT